MTCEAKVRTRELELGKEDPWRLGDRQVAIESCERDNTLLTSRARPEN